MGIKSLLSKPFAAYIDRQNQKWIHRPVEAQEKTMNSLVNSASATAFGKDHDFGSISSYNEFKQRVPINDYEGLKPYVDRVVKGERDILWPGLPTYFAKTSGTTSGVKYIPITKESIPNHINSARNALLNYVHKTGKAKWVDGNLIFLSGSPTLTKTSGIHTGRLSGIVNHHVPGYLRKNQMPSYDTNCIEDWETKLDAIIGETMQKNMTLISGIPPWVQMYFDRITEKTGKQIKDVFPNFDLFAYGGVNFKPYREKLFDSIGKKVDSIETFPASEGFFAYQDELDNDGLLMLLDSGIFFEFIPMDEYFDENPTRLSISEVKVGVNYALILNNNAGLWGYSIGDTVKFVSTDPYRLLVTGRIKHFISAFGEHVIGEEVEKAMRFALSKHPEAELTEFTVAPSVNPEKGQSCHEWFVEFEQQPSDLKLFASHLDQELARLNTYYDDLITGNILKPLELKPLNKDAFILYMKSIGKLGGQNKTPRLSNDRKVADELMQFIINV